MHIEMLLSVPAFYWLFLYQFVAKYQAVTYPLSLKNTVNVKKKKKKFAITNMYLNEKEI